MGTIEEAFSMHDPFILSLQWILTLSSSNDTQLTNKTLLFTPTIIYLSTSITQIPGDSLPLISVRSLWMLMSTVSTAHPLIYSELLIACVELNPCQSWWTF